MADTSKYNQALFKMVKSVRSSVHTVQNTEEVENKDKDTE